MCENQNMEKKNEDTKVVHSQHARILKEEDEIWISSEDLNTENSSDDEKLKQAYKKKLKLKHRKRSSPNIKIQRPSITSIPSTSRDVDERLLMPKSEDHHSKSDDSRTSDEEYSFPLIPSECLSKRLSLEDWRPMKGALNISSLEDAASTAGSTRKMINETSNFYNIMLYKLKDLKSCPVLKSAQKEKRREEKLPDETKTFKFLKNTPEVKQKLSYIRKLDDEISEAIGRYKAEREERLNTEFELCKSISETKLATERGAEVFLQMCNFDERLKSYKKQADQLLPPFSEGVDYKTLIFDLNKIEDEESIQEMETESTETLNENCQNEVNKNFEVDANSMSNDDGDGDKASGCWPTNFIRRNIYAAKEGMMANFSLTDEEKTKIANILKDIDDFQLDDADLVLSTEALTENPENSSNSENTEKLLENDSFNYANAFTVSNNDKIRMGQINNYLEKFVEEENLNEKGSSSKEVTVVKDDEYWKKYAMDQALKDIDAKLDKLYESYVEDEDKIKRNVKTEDEINSVEVSG